MRFLTLDDFKVVADQQTLDVISQQSDENINKAEGYAIDEISSYLQGRFDMIKTFLETGENRNSQITMYACDIALFHLISWVPKRMGFELRETRYKLAIDWLKNVQAGKATPNLPPIQDTEGNEVNTSIKFGSWTKNRY